MDRAGRTYSLQNDRWIPEAVLRKPTAALDDLFGFSVKVNGTGNIVIVGASGDIGGAVYRYVRSTTLGFNVRCSTEASPSVGCVKISI